MIFHKRMRKMINIQDNISVFYILLIRELEITGCEMLSHFISNDLYSEYRGINNSFFKK